METDYTQNACLEAIYITVANSQNVLLVANAKAVLNLLTTLFAKFVCVSLFMRLKAILHVNSMSVVKQSIEYRKTKFGNMLYNLLASGKAVRDSRGSLAPSVSGENGKLDEKKGRWQKRRSKTDTQVVDSVLKTG